MPMTFDKTAPFSTFHPPYNGAVYWQNGANFSADGELLWRDEGAVDPEPEPEAAASDERPAETPAPAVDPAQDSPSEPEPTPNPGQSDDADDRTLLTTWLRGESTEKVNFFTAKSWGKAVFDLDFRTKADLIRHCVTEGLVSAEDVRA